MEKNRLLIPFHSLFFSFFLINFFTLIIIFISFWICTPQPPGEFNLIGPDNTTESTVPSPVNLSWSKPVPLGLDCQDSSSLSGSTPPNYRVSLSQSNPPSFFIETSNPFLELKNIQPGIWYWTVSAANAYFSTSTSEIWSFKVIFIIIIN